MQGDKEANVLTKQVQFLGSLEVKGLPPFKKRKVARGPVAVVTVVRCAFALFISSLRLWIQADQIQVSLHWFNQAGWAFGNETNVSIPIAYNPAKIPAFTKLLIQDDADLQKVKPAK